MNGQMRVPGGVCALAPERVGSSRPTKALLLAEARAFVAKLCPGVRELRQDYAAKNIATQLDRAWKDLEREQ